MRLSDLAKSLELELHGDAELEISRIAAITDATAESLSFVVGKRYADALSNSHAGAVLVPPDMADIAPGNYLISENPYLSYAQASRLLYPEADYDDGIDPSARISDRATVDSTASIGANTVICDGAQIGANCIIGAGCYIGTGSIVGANCRLFANVTIYHHCVVGSDCRFQSGAVIGAEGFGYAPGQDGWSRINQIGGVRIGDRVEIGANTTIDRGAIDDTVISDGVILDNQIQIAHNVQIGENTAIAGCVGVAGSTVIGRNCRIGGKAAIVGHLNITDNVTLTATSFVSKSITEPGVYSSGMPLQSSDEWRKTFARIGQLDAIARRVNRSDK